eukprot:Nitzschia sp. Nitz4//scaffold51_size120721//58751//59971//NITZ4_003729-RA/size120721-processed-gene-0.125-mRNA-1//1//CDS//3329553868//8433//frame0
MNLTVMETIRSPRRTLKFHIVAPPAFTTDLLLNDSESASQYYQSHLNEESAEVWLHRGFLQMTTEEGHTNDPKQADVILIAGYFHLNAALQKKNDRKAGRKAIVDLSVLLQTYKDAILTKTGPTQLRKPHVLLIPTWNPSVSKSIGVFHLAKMLREQGRMPALWSVGFERNQMWQGVPPTQIIPIPYVVRPEGGSLETLSLHRNLTRMENFVFFAGDPRKNAKAWAGCHRDRLILPLENATNMDVRLVDKNNRLEQSQYNLRMQTSEYCLILCGDTPSSRSLTSAMVSGCIPIRVGSRLRGLCEPPCHPGFGWKPTGPENPHLPFSHAIAWDTLPEVDEQRFLEEGRGVLQELFTKIDAQKKLALQQTMQRVQSGWIYGWGDPVNSTQLGNATRFIWDSLQNTLPS